MIGEQSPGLKMGRSSGSGGQEWLPGSTPWKGMMKCILQQRVDRDLTVASTHLPHEEEGGRSWR